ncbi:MAG TPA: pyridoxal-phosphate dependent enzyme, partial [Candidatus Binataceae bacterium]|nr:pyridoxal-phosphate dependent enzyme [Candidatus Binataceae bacterium]
MATTFQSSPRSRADAEPAARDLEHEAVPVARAQSVLELIGNTPLLEITRLVRGTLAPGVRIFAKLEGFNPGGSVKDRAARKMIEVGLADGSLRPGKTIIDSTSGNTGIALAMVGAAIGYPVELVMAENASRERKKIIQAFGAKITFSDPMESSDGAILLCRKLIAQNPGKYFKPDQY